MGKLEIIKIKVMSNEEIMSMLTQDQVELCKDMYKSFSFADVYRDEVIDFEENNTCKEFIHPREFFKKEYESYIELKKEFDI